MRSREDLEGGDRRRVRDLAETAVRALAWQDDPDAFAHLLRLYGVVEECLGASA